MKPKTIHTLAKHIMLSGLIILKTLPSSAQKTQNDLYENAWLDDSYSKQAVAWANAETEKTLSHLKNNPVFDRYRKAAESILTRPGRLPRIQFSGDNVFNYYQGADNPLGLWQRTSRSAFFSGSPRWQTLLDLDALAETEGRKWLFAGANCNAERCLVSLSDNGKDAHEIREFDLTTSTFMPNGFFIAEDKSSASWYDNDTLLVTSTLEGGRANESGLPSTLRLWRRGTDLASATILFEIENRDAFLFPMLVRAGGVDGLVVTKRPSFFDTEYTYVGIDGSRIRLPLPRKAQILGGFKGGLLLRLNQDWQPYENHAAMPNGALISVSLQSLMNNHVIRNARIIYAPQTGEAIRSATSIGDSLFIEVLRGYRSAIVAAKTEGTEIKVETLNLPKDHFISLRGTHDNKLALQIEAPLTVPYFTLFDPNTAEETVLFEAEAAFDTSQLTVKLLHTASTDGTPLSYTIMHHKNMMYDGKNPTLIYGYGGFDVAITPRYEPLFGKLWLEEGGVYVHAYMRGGGERGPQWHQSAMLKNRQKPYNDMVAIINDLHKRGITQPKHTGIMGRSNGGLMVAAVMTQRPDLLNAVVVGGPLIDMLTYHQLGPGATWTAEYGDPRDSRDIRNFISMYSPLQQLKPGESYPAPLIITSIDDDRVWPGHARRFHAKLKEQGHDSLYFEDKQGGHYWELAGGPAPGDYRLRAVARAIEFTYLKEQLAQ